MTLTVDYLFVSFNLIRVYKLGPWPNRYTEKKWGLLFCKLFYSIYFFSLNAFQNENLCIKYLSFHFIKRTYIWRYFDRTQKFLRIERKTFLLSILIIERGFLGLRLFHFFVGVCWLFPVYTFSNRSFISM